MRKLIATLPLVVLALGVVGCSQQSPEDAERAKYPPHKEDSPEEVKAFLNKSNPGGGGGAPPQNAPAPENK